MKLPDNGLQSYGGVIFETMTDSGWALNQTLPQTPEHPCGAEVIGVLQWDAPSCSRTYLLEKRIEGAREVLESARRLNRPDVSIAHLMEYIMYLEMELVKAKPPGSHDGAEFVVDNAVYRCGLDEETKPDVVVE